MLKIISFCLWGNNPKYTIGAIKNAELAEKIYSDWTCRFYIGSSVDVNIIKQLKSKPNTEVVLMKDEGSHLSKFWRFLPASEENVDVMISRDTDSRLSLREKIAVDEWLNSYKGFHIIRDHPWHKTEILAGMWGVKNSVIKNIGELIKNFEKTDRYEVDQDFLRKIIYPLVKNNAMVHDEFFDYDDCMRSIPSPRVNYEFIGDVFDENDKRDENFWKILRDSIKSNPITIWSTFFLPKDKDRLNELETCIKLNCENPNIEKLVLLCENSEPNFKHEKLELISIDKRPSFNTFFELFKDEDINVLINTDIILDYDDTLKFKNIKKDEVFALTRYEIGNRIIKNYDDISKKRVNITKYNDDNDIFSCTTDIWAILGKPLINDKTDYFFELGIPGCEISLLYSLYKNGYKIFNPCLSIHTYHYHKNEDRSYYKRAYEFPRLFNVPAIIETKTTFYKITNKFSVSMVLFISSIDGKPWKKFRDTPLFKTLKLLNEITEDDIATTYYIGIKSGIGYENFIDDIDMKISFLTETYNYRNFIENVLEYNKNKYTFISNDINVIEKNWIYKAIKKIINCGENTLIKPLDSEFPQLVNSDYLKNIFSK